MREAMVSCLIAEDEAIIAMALAEAIEEAGFDVLGPFSRCSAVLDALDHRIFDAAILDAQLQDGPSEVVALEHRRRNIPFVICSGHPRTGDRRPAFADAPWVEKPATPTEVLDVLRATMGFASPAFRPEQPSLHAATFEHAPVAAG